MAPDRGIPSGSSENWNEDMSTPSDDEHGLEHETSRSIAQEPIGQEPDAAFLAKRSEQPQFTARALFTGILIGILIAFSNTYFGLQTGWVSSMAMPSALIGFAYFKGLRTFADRMGGPLKRMGFGEGFSEVENVLVQTVAGSVGTMPLGCGFVGVVPALEFLLKPSEIPDSQKPHALATSTSQEAMTGIRLPMSKLIGWALGLCFFGVLFAVPLRKEVIVREKLKFPSGTATALMIGVLHGGELTGVEGNIEQHSARRRRRQHSEDDEESRALIGDSLAPEEEEPLQRRDSQSDAAKRDWQEQIRLLITSFCVSGAYTLVSYFIPQLHSIPILGSHLSEVWLWNLNPSPAYVGQGIIMGPSTTIHMFIGSVIGWAVLSPIAKHEGWASGPVSDWNTGSKGWIVWVSLAIMLADAIISLGWLVMRPAIWYSREYGPEIFRGMRRRGVFRYLREVSRPLVRGYSPVNLEDPVDGDTHHALRKTKSAMDIEEYDAPPEHQIGVKTTLIGLFLSLVFCIGAVQYSFAGIISIGLTVLALVLALLLSIMGVRALGETDLNPVSGISKLTQLIFAAVVPAGTPNAVTINLIAGGISEAGALQAGDLLQDLKTGHLLGASPKAQFIGQLIGSGIGAVVSACVYRLYTNVYTIPGGLFQVPTGFVWVFTARLVTGQGLPPKTAEFAFGAAIIWALLTVLRIYGTRRKAAWVPYVPGGIAVAVGMYNTPSFTLARTAGGLLAWYWTQYKRRAETPMIVLASGLILGEGLLSIVNLGLASAKVPHLMV